MNLDVPRSEPSVNETRLLGRIGNDPESGYTNTGKAFLKFRLATTEQIKDETGVTKDITEWHTVVTFGKAAETLRSMLQRGTRVAVHGSNRTRKWQDSDNRMHTVTEVKANRIIAVDNLKPRPGASNTSAQPTTAEASSAI